MQQTKQRKKRLRHLINQAHLQGKQRINYEALQNMASEKKHRMAY